MWQLLGKFIAGLDKKSNYSLPISSWLNHSIGCFYQTLNVWLCKWSNLKVQGVRPSFLPVGPGAVQVSPLCHWDDTNWSTEVGTHFPSEEKLGEVCREAAIIISNISASLSDTQGVTVSRVTCLDYWICHVTRLWLPSLRWHWSLISRPGSQLSELYIVGNHPAGIISPLSRDIVCLHSGHN